MARTAPIAFLLALGLVGCTAGDSARTLATVAPSKGSSAGTAPKSTFSEAEYGVAASPRVALAGSAIPKGGGHQKIGKPYKIRGTWYVPKDEPGYDRRGKASWYGPKFHGRKTANGEVFDQHHLSAAHTTFPLPSYARVTNLANGRSVIVRVNDRGPYSHSRIIDVSKKTAEVLKFKNAGTANVRVQYLGRAPLEGDDTGKLVASLEVNGPGEAGRSVAPAPAPARAVVERVAAPVGRIASTGLGLRGAH